MLLTYEMTLEFKYTIIEFLIVKGCMLPKLDEIHNFYALRLKENYYYIATCRVTPLQNCFQAFRGQKL